MEDKNYCIFYRRLPSHSCSARKKQLHIWPINLLWYRNKQTFRIIPTVQEICFCLSAFSTYTASVLYVFVLEIQFRKYEIYFYPYLFLVPDPSHQWQHHSFILNNHSLKLCIDGSGFGSLLFCQFIYGFNHIVIKSYGILPPSR